MYSFIIRHCFIIMTVIKSRVPTTLNYTNSKFKIYNKSMVLEICEHIC